MPHHLQPVHHAEEEHDKVLPHLQSVGRGGPGEEGGVVGAGGVSPGARKESLGSIPLS